MKYYCDLYVSETLMYKKGEIIQKIKDKKIQIDKYIIVLSHKTDEYLEIYNTGILLQDYYNTDDWFLVGITDSLWDAMAYVEKLTAKVYKETNDANIRQYIKDRQQQFEEGNG